VIKGSSIEAVDGSLFKPLAIAWGAILARDVAMVEDGGGGVFVG
jgi:hypothetical protein